MKQKIHANSIIYYISLALPVVLTAIILLLYVVAFFAVGVNEGDAGVFWLVSAVWLVIYFCLFMTIPLATYGILYLVQIYRMWNAINDGKARMTPGQAIGFLFIPFYNLYWMFKVWGGFATDYNSYLDRHRLQQKVPSLKRELFDFFPVIILLSAFIITVPVLLIVFAVLLKRTNTAIDNLKSAVTAAVPEQIQPQPIQMPVVRPETGFAI